MSHLPDTAAVPAEHIQSAEARSAAGQGHHIQSSTPSDASLTPQTAGAKVMPPSAVADVNYPNVPETSEPQQAATGPGQGGVVGGEESTEKIPFKEQVNGYAKKIAGTVFGNKEEKEFGHKKLQGEA